MSNELLENSGSRNGAIVVWLALHTAEGGYDSDPADVGIDAGSARSLLQFFRNSIGTSDPKSSHAIADDDEILDDLVPYSRKAFTLRSGNPKSDNLEQMGLAKWDRATWLTHKGLLHNAAVWIVRCAKARGWSLADIRHLTVTEVKAGNVRGVIAHVDYTNATGDGTHWDCGPNYPMDVVIADARRIFSGESTTTVEDGTMAYDQDDANHLAHLDTMISGSFGRFRNAAEATAAATQATQAAAERTATASERTADASERIATALEQITGTGTTPLTT